MTSILSAISGHFNRALIFGTVVPVLMFMSLAAWLLESWLPVDPPWHALAEHGAEWQAAAAFLAVALATGVLHSVNVPLTRLYEGYPWKKSFIGKRRVARYEREYQALAARWAGYRALRYAVENDAWLAAAGATDEQREELIDAHADVGRALTDEFPIGRSILPTRLGNVIRAFESYPSEQYKMSAITLWPRLMAVIDKDYAAAITEQRTAFDFMLNCSALAFVCGGMLAGVGLAFPVPFASTPWMVIWLGQIGALVALGYMFYEGAIDSAGAWGEMVKGAFDLYRHALLRKLGFRVVPRTLAEERRVWHQVTQQTIFGDARRVRLPPFVGTSTHVEAVPAWLAVSVHRAVEPPDASGVQRIHLRATNDDLSKRTAATVVLVEELAPNNEFVYGSILPATVRVEGVNPLRFHVGTLDAGKTGDVTFQVVRYK